MSAEDQPKPKVDDTSVPASGSESNLYVPESDSGTPKNASFSGSGENLTPSPAGSDGTPNTSTNSVNVEMTPMDQGTPKGQGTGSESGDGLTPSPADSDGTPATQMHEPVTPPTDEASLPSSGTPVSPAPLDLSQETVENAEALHLSPKVCKKKPLNPEVLDHAKELGFDANGICEDMLKAEEQCKAAAKKKEGIAAKFLGFCSKLWKSVKTPSSSIIANPNTHDLFGVDQ